MSRGLLRVDFIVLVLDLFFMVCLGNLAQVAFFLGILNVGIDDYENDTPN